MNKDTVFKAFNCELPSYCHEMFYDFEKIYDRSKPLITESEIDSVKNATGMPEECFETIEKVNAALCADGIKHAAAWLLRYVLIGKRLPWENYIYNDNVLTVGDFSFESVNLLFVTANLANTLINKKPPQDLNEENLRSYRGYVDGCHSSKGFWGVTEFNWNMLCSGGCMFMCGALKFCPSFFTDDFIILKKGSEYISLLGGEFRVNSYGELVNENEAFELISKYERSNDLIKAHRISKEGIVSKECESFSLDEYELFLGGGSCTLDFHIPTGMEYTPKVVGDAYAKAVKFYKGFYPEFDFKAIAGYSWIFAPQLDLVLPENSNILAVRNSVHVLPTVGTYDESNRFIRKGSGMQARMAKQIADGRRFHYAIMYLPLDEIDSMTNESSK